MSAFVARMARTTSSVRTTTTRRGDLVSAGDALGHAYRFEYVNHLLVKETDKNGLSFYFQYDGIDASAKCIRTWGDGGIYDHVITYDTVKRITLVENSLGENTLYQMDEAGQVVSVTDAAGRTTKYEYDDDSGQLAKKVDPAGNTASREYDDRGNLAGIIVPDGATLSIQYNQRDLPERLMDALGNVWHWEYSLEGQLVARIDPLGARTQLHWEGARLVALVNPAGREFVFEYDDAGNVRRLIALDGVESQWHYDGLGRCHTLVDANGNRQTRERDALGRIVAVAEPDGNLRRITYDPQSNVIDASDQHHDVKFEYRGVGRLAAREENQRRVEFEYDTEERLIAIRNEHGSVYRFELGPGGDVLEEYGFGGLRRRYLRDRAGRVVEVRRPQNRRTKYAYDVVGRVTAVLHDDGTRDVYGYRPDGELVLAENAACHIELERDALGRVIEERRDRDWIRSEYDVLGFRTRVTSSKRFEQRIRRNATGDVLSIEAGIHSLPASPSVGSAMPLVTGPYRVDSSVIAWASSSNATSLAEYERGGSATLSGGRRRMSWPSRGTFNPAAAIVGSPTIG